MPKKGSLTPLGRLEKRYVRIPARRLSPVQAQRLIEAREKQNHALELRKAGMNYEEIAKVVGYKHKATAQQAVRKAIDRIGLEPAKEVVLLDLVRLEEFQKRLTAALRQNNDLSVIPMIMNVMRERRALLGFNAESWAEEQRKGEGVVNNGVMVISGSSSEEFVRGMMQVVGVDPNSPEAKKRLALVRSQQEKEGTGEFAPVGPKPNELLAAAASSALNENPGNPTTLEGNVTLGREIKEVDVDEDY